MKVAMIGHKQIPSRTGGVEIVVEELSVQLKKMNVDVDVYNRRGKGRKALTEYKGVHIYEAYTIHMRNLDAIVATFFATLKALRKSYDVLHYHAEGPCLMLFLPHLFRKRLIVTIHGLDWQRAKWGKAASKMLLLGEKSAVRYADEIIVLSKNMQKYFMDTYGRKTKYIPNGIQMAEMKEPNLIQKKYRLEKEGYILFLARIVPEKGLHYLIDAYQKTGTKAKLVIAGDCQYSPEYGAVIKKKCKNDPNIILTGFVEGDLLCELFSNALIYVLPSEIEGMAISLLEAMSYGRCCLLSDIPENMEVAGEYAEYFHVADVEDLRKKLLLLLENSTRREFLGKKAQEYVVKSYQWSQIAEKTLKVYEGK